MMKIGSWALVVVEAGLYPYDIQAPIAVIEAAGGIVTDWRGNPVHEGGRVRPEGHGLDRGSKGSVQRAAQAGHKGPRGAPKGV